MTNNKKVTKILGIDPGLEKMGLGLIEYSKDNIKYKEHTLIKTKTKHSIQDRLANIFDELKQYCKKNKPDVIVIEEIFAGINRNTIIKLSMARTIPILCSTFIKADLIHIPTRIIKQVITGYGAAEKHLISQQVCNILKIPHIDNNLDCTDALACAISSLYSDFI